MKHKNIVTAADAGDRLETLKALRHKLAEQLRDCESGRDVAALSRQLREVMEEIGEMESAEKKDSSTALSLISKKYGT